jgi:uncharacterized radical SAM superfamily protein
VVIVTVKIFIPNGHYLYVSRLGKEFYSYPPISLTSRYCALHCKHCNAEILKRMISVSSPSQLTKLALDLYKQGVKGILISGGSDSYGRVPFERFIDAIKYIKKLGLRIYIHTGLVDEFRAQLLKEASVDVALIDFIVKKEIIRSVMNLNASAEDFINSVKNLIRFNVKVAPHIIIGIFQGNPSGEKEAIDILKDLNPNAVILAVFTPMSNTAFEKSKPPTPQHIYEILKYARINLDIPLSYGCMKPHEEAYQLLEIEALRLGFEGISFPSYATLEYFINNNIPFEIMQECCAYIAL